MPLMQRISALRPKREAASATLPDMNWKWRVRHAHGYRELGLIAEAKYELSLIAAPHSEESDVLAEHVALHQETGEWPQLEKVCRQLARRHPEDPAWWIMWAYGARRADSLTAAEKVLLEAEMLHAEDATIQFNLGCYACQLGNLAAARARVQRAIALDRNFEKIAQNDADLEPLRKVAPQS
jgi:Flp pilus assembly protein TadD